MYHYLQKEAYIVNSCLPEINFAIKHETSENQSDTVDCLTYPGRAGRGCCRLRLRNIRQSNKPVIQLKAIGKMNNSFHSDNFIFPINAASQVLTLSNIPPQSPSASSPRPVPEGASTGLYPTDFLHSSNQKYLPRQSRSLL